MDFAIILLVLFLGMSELTDHRVGQTDQIDV